LFFGNFFAAFGNFSAVFGNFFAANWLPIRFLHRTRLINKLLPSWHCQVSSILPNLKKS
jgi:hypothetical protein